MKKIKVREGNTDILYITHEDSREERFIPDYDLDKANELLMQFYTIKDSTGKLIKDNYWVNEINWFPTVVSYLYWHVFYNYIRYEVLLKDIFDGKYTVEFENKRRFYLIYNLLFMPSPKINTFKRFIYNLVIKVSNKKVVKKCEYDILFYPYGLNNFRTTDIKKALDELGVDYIEVVPPSLKELIYNIVYTKPKPYYFLGGKASHNIFLNQYDLEQCTNYHKRLFTSAIEKINEIISSFIYEYQIHKKILRVSKARVFYGLDDVSDIYPILYACSDLGIKTIGHQHGAYNKRQAAYMMDGFKPSEYKWFDNVIVWGDYWRDQMLKNSKVYPHNFFLTGSNKKQSYLYFIPKSSPDRSSHKNVLIPYEFLANTYLIGKYIRKLIDIGYTIYFKARPDEEVKDQLEAYCLPEEYKKQIIVVQDITDEFMVEIDIVAGTYTAVIYELLPYGKETWIFDTEFKLSDLVEQGYAKLVKYDELDHLSMNSQCVEINKGYFFNQMSLKDVIDKYVFSSKT